MNRIAKPNPAFTLIELMITIGIIALVAGIALPTMTALFTSGQDTQSYNLLATQILSARAVALQSGTYAGLHVRMADAEDLQNKCYTVIVWDDPTTANHTFTAHPAYTPQPLSGSMAAGKIDNTTVDDAGNYKDGMLGSTTDIRDHFVNFTILFTPDGKVSTLARGQGITIADDSLYGDNAETDIWDSAPDPHAGVNALTLFDYGELVRMENATRQNFLDESGMILPVNVHTGQLVWREGE